MLKKENKPHTTTTQTKKHHYMNNNKKKPKFSFYLPLKLCQRILYKGFHQGKLGYR